MKDTGKLMLNMELVQKYIKMEINIKDNMKFIKKMVKEYIYTVTEINMMEIG